MQTPQRALGAVAGPRAGQPVAAQATTSLPRLPLLLVALILFAVSGGMLWKVGINYEGLTGNGPSKIHPSTYLICLLFGWVVLSSKNAVETLVGMMEKRPASLFLLAATACFFIQIVSRKGPGMAGVLDTFVPPALMVMLLSRANEKDFRAAALLIHAVMGVNALIGLFEFASGTLLFPYRFDGDVFTTDLRSSALQGHPLVNATITAFYALALIGGGGRALPAWMPLPMIGLQCLALVTFGGRSAMVVTIVLGGLYLLVATHRTLARGRVSLPLAAGALLLLTLIPVAIAVLAAQGFFDALLQRFVSDGGSANARVEMLGMFDDLSWRDILVGPDPEWIDSTRRINGLEWGIENPFIRTLLYQGLILTTLQTAALVLFFRELARITGPGTFLPMLGFILLLNTSESIGGKTTMLTKFALLLICFFPRQPAARAVRR